jgi:hypothetical protein
MSGAVNVTRSSHCSCKERTGMITPIFCSPTQAEIKVSAEQVAFQEPKVWLGQA